MKLSAFSAIWAIIYLVFGLGLLVIPVLFMKTYGVALDHEGEFVTRILGSSLTAFGLIYWFNRRVAITDRAQANLVLGSFIYNIIDIPVVLTATLNGYMNQMGWIPVVLHIFLAATFGYFVFKRD